MRRDGAVADVEGDGEGQAASTVSFRPIALVTATSVDSLGLPFCESARYKLSRSIPAALATLAIPPLASANRRSAIRSTFGSSVSSSAALRYSTAKSRSSRSIFFIVSSWGTLGLCFMFAAPFLVIREPLDCCRDVGRLASFVATAQQKHDGDADHGVI